jgi:hypothetical protein
MPLPEFNDNGDLPVGLHAATLAEAIHRFGTGSARRQILAIRRQRIYDIAIGLGFLARFVVFGSFVTAKEHPNDVDVFMVMNDNFNVGDLSGEAKMLFDHSSAETHFGCSVFWVRKMGALGGEQIAIEDWEIKRDGSRRGIMEVIGL